MDAPARSHTGGRPHSHLPSAVLALIFIARRIQPSLSLVDREAEFLVPTAYRSPLLGMMGKKIPVRVTAHVPTSDDFEITNQTTSATECKASFTQPILYHLECSFYEPVTVKKHFDVNSPGRSEMHGKFQDPLTGDPVQWRHHGRQAGQENDDLLELVDHLVRNVQEEVAHASIGTLLREGVAFREGWQRTTLVVICSNFFRP